MLASHCTQNCEEGRKGDSAEVKSKSSHRNAKASSVRGVRVCSSWRSTCLSQLILMHNALTFCRMFHTHTHTQNRPPSPLMLPNPHSRHGPPPTMLTHAGAFNTLDEASRIRGNCRWLSNGTAPHAGWAILHFWFPCFTHTHTRTHWRPRTHASCRDSLRFWLRLRLRLCDMKYSCNRRHQNVCLQRAFNCISSAGRKESKSKSKYFRYVFGCAPSRHDIAIFFFFSALFFSAFKQAAGKQFFSALWSAIQAAHAVRVKRAVNIARHRLLNALESWKKKKKKKKVKINVASCNPNGAALKMQHAQCCPSWGWQQELLHGRNTSMHDLRFSTAWVACTRSKVIALTAPHRVDAYSRVHVFRAEKCHLSWWGNINGNGNSGRESKRSRPES